VGTRTKDLEAEVAELKTRIGKIEWEAERLEKRVSSLEDSTRNDGQKWDGRIMASEERNLTAEVRIVKLEQDAKAGEKEGSESSRGYLCSRRALLLDYIK
jgi:predicted nuclease with TOPRIM domain